MENYFKCIKCNQIYPFTKDILTCPNHNKYYGYLTLMYNFNNVKFKKNDSSWIKYSDLLPIKNYKIQLDDQKTPLFRLEKLGKKYNLSNLFLKDESKNLTGSFKDKESFVLINKFVEWGINDIFIVSSGNAAISTAAYAQKLDIKCTCYVPNNLSVGKRYL